MATEVTTLQARRMVGRPPQIDVPAEALVFRVRGVGVGRWLLERYAGVREEWHGLHYFDSRTQAYAEAARRREMDVVVLVCAACTGVLGHDLDMTCEDCGVPAMSPAVSMSPWIHALPQRRWSARPPVGLFEGIVLVSLLAMLVFLFGDLLVQMGGGLCDL